MPDQQEEPFYKCRNCGAEGKFRLVVTRNVNYIYDGYMELPIGEEDRGASVACNCTVCHADMDPHLKDVEKWHKPKGIIFYKNI